MDGTKVLVASASKHGSTAEIAEAIARTLQDEGLHAEHAELREVRELSPYRGVVVGSAVYTMRWRSEAVSFLRRNRAELAGHDVWLFQSGPLDRSAEEEPIPLPKKVAAIATTIGNRGHATFGGKLDAERKGFPASAMIKNGLGQDFRNFDQIRTWAREVAHALGAASHA